MNASTHHQHKVNSSMIHFARVPRYRREKQHVHTRQTFFIAIQVLSYLHFCCSQREKTFCESTIEVSSICYIWFCYGWFETVGPDGEEDYDYCDCPRAAFLHQMSQFVDVPMLLQHAILDNANLVLLPFQSNDIFLYYSHIQWVAYRFRKPKFEKLIKIAFQLEMELAMSFLSPHTILTNKIVDFSSCSRFTPTKMDEIELIWSGILHVHQTNETFWWDYILTSKCRRRGTFGEIRHKKEEKRCWQSFVSCQTE